MAKAKAGRPLPSARITESAPAKSLPLIPPDAKKLRVAMAAWEIGRADSGFGVKIGGLGAVVEELPLALIQAAAEDGLELEIETLSPCFAHYDRRKLEKLDRDYPVTIENHTFNLEAYKHDFPATVELSDGRTRQAQLRMVYFWDEWQLRWTGVQCIYPNDPWMAAKLYAALAQGMAAYIREYDFQTVHLHDYHVGLIPFYLGDEYLRRVPAHFTIHNASYQGITPLKDGGYSSLDRLNLPGEKLFHRYFDFFDNLNFLKACVLKVHETGGRVTTVSGDLEGTWGYAAELRHSHPAVFNRAAAQKGRAPLEVFVPNRHLDVLERIPAAGITNGLSRDQRPERMPELRAEALRAMQARHKEPLFRQPRVQEEMLRRDHNFDAEHLEMKQELRRLLYLEAFGHEIWGYPALLTAVGRLAEQKGFDLIAGVIDWVMAHDGQARFIVLASAPKDDPYARALEGRYFDLMRRYPGRVYFNNAFNRALSKLILAGGDFVLVPSRFEPCGLVDYEAALLGTVPIVHATGGLTKVRHCGYLYDWLDMRDPGGEAAAFFTAIKEALRVYRQDHQRHRRLMLQAMATVAGWEKSARQYLELYRYGLWAKRWRELRWERAEQFAAELNADRDLFHRYFAPGQREYGDRADWELKDLLGG